MTADCSGFNCAADSHSESTGDLKRVSLPQLPNLISVMRSLLVVPIADKALLTTVFVTLCGPLLIRPTWVSKFNTLCQLVFARRAAAAR